MKSRGRLDLGRATAKRSLCSLVLVISLLGGLGCKMENRKSWRAIIAFTDREAVSEDWNWFFGDLLEACKGTDIFVVHAGPGQTQVAVGPRDRPLATIDLSPHRGHRHGYLFVEAGREARYEKYDQSFVVLEKASEYFHTTLSRRP